MRTTLTLNIDAFEYAHAYADAKAMKLGDAVSELIQKARTAVIVESKVRPKPTDTLGMKFVSIPGSDGLWVFDTPDDAPKMTAEEVRRLIVKSEQDEDDRLIAMSQRLQPKNSQSRTVE